MKKTLLLASAAVLFASSASAMEKGLELGIEGYASVYGVFADQDGTGADLSEFGLRKEMEIDFTGEVDLENGLTVGVTVETTTEDDDETNEQEAYMFVEGNFGKVIVGSEYNAAYLMQVAAPAVDAEFDGMDPTYNVITTGSNLVDEQSYAMFGDGNTLSAGADKITYVSPIWEGLQAGVSYTPDTDEEGERGGMSTTKADEGFSVAARYANDFWGAEWTIGAGYNENNFQSTGDVEEEWNVGLNSEFNAWKLGVAYYAENDQASNEDTQAIAAGANYETGNFNYGASFLYKEVDGGDTDDLMRYMAGVNYTYGPGMTLNGSLSFNEYSSDNNSAYENDATVVAVGTVINF